MSTYYNYYLGFMKDGELHYAGPYDRFGKPLELVTFSDSLIGNRELRGWFYPAGECSQEVHDNFVMDYSFSGDESDMALKISYAPLKDLNRMKGNEGVRKGFVPIMDIDALESDPYAEPEYVIEEVLSPFGYAALPPEEQRKYAFYMWKEHTSVDALAGELCTIANNMVESIVYNSGENMFKEDEAVIFYPSPY